jgi:hypothetical protein
VSALIRGLFLMMNNFSSLFELHLDVLAQALDTSNNHFSYLVEINVTFLSFIKLQ